MLLYDFLYIMHMLISLIRSYGFVISWGQEFGPCN